VNSLSVSIDGFLSFFCRTKMTRRSNPAIRARSTSPAHPSVSASPEMDPLFNPTSKRALIIWTTIPAIRNEIKMRPTVFNIERPIEGFLGYPIYLNIVPYFGRPSRNTASRKISMKSQRTLRTRGRTIENSGVARL
jgi:hypothetical protein